ncbi:hypothetical protein [Oceanirhabdus seepicola]|uniref:DUF6199 domain-containing protein n=1 Tax=Oceanirhabdus seepicola TaxID=2828781 RepID=A0A9J6P030_9CLOT|nr:hypothetical protein [Oceanirhabdus seepicola]MCM1989558.1 hypothetical protein [Oceanirhabdus seepicola]
MKIKRVLKVLFLLFIMAIFIIAFKNSVTPCFYLNDHLYVKKSSDGNEINYYSIKDKKSIKVSEKEDYKEIKIQGNKYKVFGQPNDFLSKDEKDMVKIEYPDGAVNEGWYYENMGFYKIDKNGEYDFTGIVRISTGNEQFQVKDEEITDRKLITIAFESLQDMKGNLAMFFPAVLFFVLGYIQFKFPVALFKLQHFLWVKDPEPTEAYIGFSKAGGFILCVMGVGMMIFGAGIFKF